MCSMFGDSGDGDGDTDGTDGGESVSEEDDEFEYRPLSECESYDEFFEEVMQEDPAIQEARVTGYRALMVRYGLYVVIALFFLVGLGLTVFAGIEVISFLAEYIGEWVQASK